MERKNVLISMVLVGMLAFTCIACGAVKNGEIDDQAARRGLHEGDGEIYIDDEAIALADSSTPNQPVLDACRAVFDIMNQQRTVKGLGTLTWSEPLTNAAQVRANEITTSFSHTRPNGSAFWTVDARVQYAENLAKLYQSAESVYDAWMNSPTHAAIIMDNKYKSVGIAICQADDGGWYWAEEFGF